MFEIYERLKALWKTNDQIPEEGSAEDGAAYAFAAALMILKQRLDKTVSELLLNAQDTDYTPIAGLLGLDPSRFTDEELAAAVSERMSHSFGDYTASELMHAFSLVGSGSFSSVRGNVTFSGVAEKDLAELGKFITAFLLPENNVIYDGDGMTFDEWESMQYTFYGYDSLTLPFAVLDSYRRTL